MRLRKVCTPRQQPELAGREQLPLIHNKEAFRLPYSAWLVISILMHLLGCSQVLHTTLLLRMAMPSLLQILDAVEAEQVLVIATGTLSALLKTVLLVMASWDSHNGISRFLLSPWLRCSLV